MKKNYINPQVDIFRIDIEQMIAESQLERGEGSGGNNAEVTGNTNVMIGKTND